MLEADTAAILLVESDGKLHVRATAGGLGSDSTIGIPIGEGMAGSVAANRAPLLVPDLSKIELYRSTLRDRGINSVVAIPLVVEDRVIGVVHAGSEAYAQFVEDDARLLELIADRIALAINQASLYEAERAAQQRLRFLGEAGALLGSSLDVEKTLEQLGQLVAGRIADWCSIHLVAEATRRAARLARAPGRDDGPPVRAALVRAVGRAPRIGESRTGAASRRATSECSSCRSNARGRTFGAMSLGWDDDDRHGGEDEVGFALDIARRAAIAIDNAQLYGAAAERAQARACSPPSATACSSSTAPASSAPGTARRRRRPARRDGGGRPRAVEAIPGWAAIVVADRGRDRGQCRAARRVAAARPRRPRALALDPRRRRAGRHRLRVPRPDRGACARADARPSSSRPSRTSCARRSRRSTAPR